MSTEDLILFWVTSIATVIIGFGAMAIFIYMMFAGFKRDMRRYMRDTEGDQRSR